MKSADSTLEVGTPRRGRKQHQAQPSGARAVSRETRNFPFFPCLLFAVFAFRAVDPSPLGNPGARSMAHGEAAHEERFQSHCDWIAAVRAEYERQVRAAGKASLDEHRHGASSHCAPR